MRSSRNKAQISIYIDADIFNILKERCASLGQSLSGIVESSIASYLSTQDLGLIEKRYVILKSKEAETRMRESLRSDNAKRLMLIPNVKKTMRLMLSENRGENVDMVVENIQESIDLAIFRGWEKERAVLEKFRDEIKAGKGRFDK